MTLAVERGEWRVTHRRSAIKKMNQPAIGCNLSLSDSEIALRMCGDIHVENSLYVGALNMKNVNSLCSRSHLSASLLTFAFYSACMSSGYAQVLQTNQSEEGQKTRGLFVAAFVSALAPSLANSVSDWIARKVLGNDLKGQQSALHGQPQSPLQTQLQPQSIVSSGQPVQPQPYQAQGNSIATLVSSNTMSASNAADIRIGSADAADLSTLALIIEAHQVSANDEPVARLTQAGSDTITVATGDRFILKFTANMPGLLRAENIDAKGITTDLGAFVIPAGEGVSIPKAKAFRMVGEPGQEQMRLVFQPCRAYSTALVRMRGIVNEDQAASMVQSDKMLNTTISSQIDDCINVDVNRLTAVAVRGIQNENFPGGIAMTSTAKSASGKIMPVSRTVNVVHNAAPAPGTIVQPSVTPEAPLRF